MNNSFAVIHAFITNTLVSAEHPDAHDRIAWWIIAHVTHKPLPEVYRLSLLHEGQITALEFEAIKKILHLLIVDRMPLAYIIGNIQFLNITLLMQSPILIPRPETEEWVERLISLLQTKPPRTILDIGTGSGCIALSLANAFPNARVVALDCDPRAIALTKANRDALGIQNVEIIEGDIRSISIQEDLIKNGLYDIIASNPPYVTQQEWSTLLAPEIVNHEAYQAHVADCQGLEIIANIIEFSSKSVLVGGMLWVEHGHKQASPVRSLFNPALWRCDSISDVAGIERVVAAERI